MAHPVHLALRGLGWLEPAACLGFVAGESWRPLSFASGVGQGRLGVVGCLDRHLLLPFPHTTPTDYSTGGTRIRNGLFCRGWITPVLGVC